MNPRLRDQAMRLLVAAFLNSNTPRRELERLLDEICASPEFMQELRSVVLGLLDRIEHRMPVSYSFNADELAEQTHHERLLQLIAKLKISKNRLATLIQAAAPNFLIPRSAQKGDAKRLLQVFLSTASADEVERLQVLLGSGAEEDPYLKGILGRR